MPGIMIVARHAQVREGLRTVLQLSGYFEITAAVPDLRAAVDRADAACPDVALVDLEMPDNEGFETIQQLKRICPDAAIIALTAHDYPSARESALQAGASRVIVKGMELQDIVAAIQGLARKS